MSKKSYWLGSLVVCTLIAQAAGVKADPIHDAAVEGDTERVEQLLAEGADVNAPDDAGTPLQWALFARQTATARLLLERGADPNVEGPAGMPLLAATMGGDVEIVKLLLDHGADPNRGDRSTPLIAAAQTGGQEIALLLLEHGADPGFATFDGVTALHKAAEGGHLEVARQLVDRGADINALTTVGTPPIHFAVAGNHADLAAYLRDQGAKPGEIAPITDLLASADVAAGTAEAKTACSECHRLDQDVNFWGPSLWNVVGRPMGRVSDFDYSPAFMALEGVWTYDALNRFLARPTEVIPGTKMGSFGYRGIADPQTRANVIAYLRTFSDAPAPLP